MLFLIAVLVFLGASSANIGYPDSGGSRMIINGFPTSILNFPHQLKLKDFGNPICGASLIHDDWALTAAHCVEGRTPFSLSVASDIGFVIPIQSIRMHPRYNVGIGHLPNDIAVLKLAPHTADLSVLAIPVANGSTDYTRTTCSISGYGLTENGYPSSQLRSAQVTVLNEWLCKLIWGFNSIVAQHICAQGNSFRSSGACYGDSGGPLTCGGELAGVTSWGLPGCHVDGFVLRPSVYARTSFFFDWIRENCDCCI